MNKSILILLLTTFSIFANAQYNEDSFGSFGSSSLQLDKFKFGFRITPSIAWVNVTHNDAFAGGATMKIGLGLSARYEINDLMAIISGINYNGFGGYMADNRTLNDVNSKDYFKVNYTAIEVPIGIRLNTPDIHKYSYYLQGGANTGFVLSANEKTFKSNGGSVLNNTNILKDLTSPSYAGIFVGVGARYKLNDKIRLFVEANYKATLTNIAISEGYKTDTDHQYTDNISILPSTTDFSFGIEF